MIETDNAAQAESYGLLAVAKYEELRIWRHPSTPGWFLERPRWVRAEDDLLEWLVVFARLAGRFGNAALDERAGSILTETGSI